MRRRQALPTHSPRSANRSQDNGNAKAKGKGKGITRRPFIRKIAVILVSVLLCVMVMISSVGSFETMPWENTNTAANGEGGGKGRGGAAICAIQKWTLRYIDEWVDYHLALGFEKIYVYDNSDEFELEGWLEERRARDEEEAGTATADDDAGQSESQRIVIKHFPGEAKQMEAYTHCGKDIKSRNAHEWIAFIDLDEFVVIRDLEKYPHIMDLLNTVPHQIKPSWWHTVEVGGLGVNWIFFGFNNQTEYEPKPVTLRFPGHLGKELGDNIHVKTIARTSHFQQAGSNPHHVKYVQPSWKYIHTTNAIDSSGNIVKFAWNKNNPSDVISLFHYHTYSLEEYMERCKRGRASVKREIANNATFCKKSAENVYEMYNRKAVLDNSPWKLLKERVPKYSQYEIESGFDDNEIESGIDDDKN